MNDSQNNNSIRGQALSTSELNPRVQVVVMLIGVLSFIAAFAWNSVAEVLLRKKFGPEGDVRANLFYAIAMTLLSVIFIYYITRYAQTIPSRGEGGLMSFLRSFDGAFDQDDDRRY